MNPVQGTYWAHSDPNGLSPEQASARWQPLRDHLVQVGELAERFALEAGASSEFARRARAAGLLHDLGKYSCKFQKMLRGEVKRAPHSVYGAALAHERARAFDAAVTIAGHHAGMPDRSTLRDRIAEGAKEIAAIWDVAVRDCPELAECFRPSTGLLAELRVPDMLRLDADCRMLLSCLVDADRLDTAQHAGGEVAGDAPRLRAAELRERLLEFIKRRAEQSVDGTVKEARRHVLDACLSGAEKAGNLFSLTVPTGGGKTLSAMAFALQRAVLRPQIRRVIAVIPYLSIIEQNARVYRDALGDEVVLEHHSGTIGAEADDDGPYHHPNHRAAVENWDAPVVVTTSVRFFESLYSNHPRDLRRIHNIARSVVILDEVQTLPRRFVKTLLSMMRDLADRWDVTFVFSTATQPALQQPATGVDKKDPRWAPGTLREIIPEPARLFHTLRRVTTEWRTGALTWSQVAGELAGEDQALVILNTRGQAMELAELSRGRGDAVLHLSNNMCPAHRLERLDEVRARLRMGRPCLLISTQLVEAGVDLDFPVVWRASGPLDSIAQSAGRCDREGNLTRALGRPGGRLVVFEPADGKMPPGVYKEAAGIAKAMAAAGPLNWDEPETIRCYFDRLYSGDLDPKAVEDLRTALRFKEVANTMKWIDDATRPVIVPFNEEARSLIQGFRFAGVSGSRFRMAQKYTVNLWEHDFRRGRALGSLAEVHPDVWACQEGLYDPTFGIRIEGTGGGVV